MNVSDPCDLVREMQTSIPCFAKALFPGHTRLPFAECHRLLFKWHARMATPPPDRRGLRFALAAPRGSAKSTVQSLILLAHDLLYRREPYIVLLSATEAQAHGRLRTLRRVLEGERAHHYFPDVVASLEATKRTLLLADSQLDVFGAGTEIRGLTSRSWRPTKIILDDAEASRVASSAAARERIAQWFAEIVEYLGDTYTHTVAVGTVLHPKGLLPTLIARPDFTSRLARSVEAWSPRDDLWSQWRRTLLDLDLADRRELAREFFLAHREEMEAETRVLWPAKEDYEQLLAQLTIQGRRAFFQEKQNTPLGPEDALFAPENALRAVRVDQNIILRTAAGDFVRAIAVPIGSERRFAYLDAALGKSRASSRGDFTALAMVLLLPDGTLILEDIWCRRAAPSQQVATLFQRHERTPFEVLAIEGTGFQELLLMPIEEERKRRIAAGLRADLPLTVVHPKKSKPARIAAIEPLLGSGHLALSPALPEEFWEEIANYPNTLHDDALDAAAGAIELARQRHAITTIASTPRTSPRKISAL